MQSIWWQVFDILGTSAFALSGALVAISRRMDVFGIFVLAAATAVGGGIVRDLMLGHTPPSAFRTTLYVWIIALSIVAVVLFIRYVNVSSRQRLVHQMESVYLVCDAIGLGSFTVTGTLMGFYYYPQYWVLNVTLGVLTAVGGGVVRDVLAGQIPGVLKKEIYATAALAGACILLSVHIYWGFTIYAASTLSFAFTVCLRLVAVRLHWNLPRVRRTTKSSIF